MRGFIFGEGQWSDWQPALGKPKKQRFEILGLCQAGAFTGRTLKPWDEDWYASGTIGKVPEGETEI